MGRFLFILPVYLFNEGYGGIPRKGFFEAIAISMPEQLLLINAVQEGQDIAAALFFKNEEKLFGRYWGSRGEYQFLHFETCYYQARNMLSKSIEIIRFRRSRRTQNSKRL